MSRAGTRLPGNRKWAVFGQVRSSAQNGAVCRFTNFALLSRLRRLLGDRAQVCDQARKDAYQRLVTHAEDKEADAIIGMRYDATEFAQSTTEVLAYGTAVKITRG